MTDRLRYVPVAVLWSAWDRTKWIKIIKRRHQTSSDAEPKVDDDDGGGDGIALDVCHGFSRIRSYPPTGSRKMLTAQCDAWFSALYINILTYCPCVPENHEHFSSYSAMKGVYCNVDSVLQLTMCMGPLSTPSNSIFTVVAWVQRNSFIHNTTWMWKWLLTAVCGILVSCVLYTMKW